MHPQINKASIEQLLQDAGDTLVQERLHRFMDLPYSDNNRDEMKNETHRVLRGLYWRMVYTPRFSENSEQPFVGVA